MLNLEARLLQLAVKRGYQGVDKVDYFRAFQGISYPLLLNALQGLERKGLIKVEWSGQDQFIVFITNDGVNIFNSHELGNVAVLKA